MSPKRRQGVSLALGLFLLIIYNEALQFGESMIDDGKLSPWLGQQLPMLLFTVLSLWIFLRASGHTPGPSWTILTLVIDWIGERARALGPAREH
jgi:hypothetical protein